MPTIIRHLEIAHENAIGDGVFAESATDLLNHILKPLPAFQFCCIYKNGKLIGVGLWYKVNGSDANRTNFASPTVAILKQPIGSRGYFRGKLCLERQLALKL